jgi:hypothetical protein
LHSCLGGVYRRRVVGFYSCSCRGFLRCCV